MLASTRGSSPPGWVRNSGPFLAEARGVPASASGKLSWRASTTASAEPGAGKDASAMATPVAIRSGPERRDTALIRTGPVEYAPAVLRESLRAMWMKYVPLARPDGTQWKLFTPWFTGTFVAIGVPLNPLGS